MADNNNIQPETIRVRFCSRLYVFHTIYFKKMINVVLFIPPLAPAINVSCFTQHEKFP